MPPAAIDDQVTHRYADSGPVRLHYVEAGQGPLVVMLHGFPEFWYSWRYQIPALVAAGYRVVAPDMRGYNLSDKPHGVGSYTVRRLARDVAELIRAAGAERAIIAGHDWGANVAWNFAMRYGNMVERLAILNVPHPQQMSRGLRTMPKQWLKSWYILFFQLPWLPEAALRAGDYAALRMVFRRDPVRRGAFSAEDVERYVAAAAHPGASTASINYYRALGRLRGRPKAAAAERSSGQVAEDMRRHTIEAPTLVIWGERDRYLSKELAAPDPRLVPHCRVERLPDASHWVQHDCPEQVNALLIAFFAEAGGAR